MMGTYPAILAVRGACRGQGLLMTGPPSRASKAVCLGNVELDACPVLDECRTWVDNDPWARVLPGTVAGMGLTKRKPGCVECGELFLKKDRISSAPYKPYCRACAPDLGEHHNE